MGLITHAMTSGVIGGSSPAPVQLNLEYIKSLKTMATMTVGDFVFAFKEPKMFYAGYIYTDNGMVEKGHWYNSWFLSMTLNEKFAALSDDIAVERINWGLYDSNNPNIQTISESIVNFKYTSISADLESYKYQLPYINKISVSYDKKEYYNGHLTRTTNTTGSTQLYCGASNESMFTDMSPEEYWKFVRSYCEAAAEHEYKPVIKIL